MSTSVEVVRSASSCPAPPGMCVLYVEVTEDGGTAHEVLPAVALRTVVSDRYEGREGARPRSTVHRRLLADGWTFRGRSVRTDVLILNPETGDPEPYLEMCVGLASDAQVLPSPFGATPLAETVAALARDIRLAQREE